MRRFKRALLRLIISAVNSTKIFLIKYKNNGRVTTGMNCKIYYKVTIDSKEGKINLGENVRLGHSVKGYHAGMPFHTTLFTEGPNSRIIIGDNCRLNGAYLHAKDEIFIGKNTVIASGVNILDSNGHVSISTNRTIGRDLPNSIHIGENVWIGINSIILKGTNIGDNSIISAGSVVKGTFESNSIISGNPATVSKKISFDKL